MLKKSYHTTPHRIGLSVFAIVLAFCAAVRGQTPAELLRAMYPGVRTFAPGRNLTYLYGAEMTPGQTEQQAVTAFLAAHAGAFFGGVPGVGRTGDAPELVQEWSMPSKSGDFVVYAFRQRIRGKEVDGSNVRIKVKRGVVPRVDFAAARLAGEPTLGSEQPLVSGEVASFLVRTQPGLQAALVEGSPEVVVLRGTGRRPDAWCWRIRTRVGEGLHATQRTHYVDTASLRVIHSAVHYSSYDPPTTGTVTGLGTPTAPPCYPFHGNGQILVSQPMGGIRVENSTVPSAHTFTDSSGAYSLSWGSTGQGITVGTSMGLEGQWFTLVDEKETPPKFLSAGATGQVGDNIPLSLVNSAMDIDVRVAQVDAVVTANRSRDFFLQYISDSAAGLNLPFSIIVNTSAASIGGSAVVRNGSGVAIAYAILFSPQTSGYWNCASHSVVGHEYGHAALDMVGLRSADMPAFHEGFADTYSYMVNDNSVFGPQQYANYGNVREDPSSTAVNCQFPLPSTGVCLCDPNDLGCLCGHAAGQLLSGPWVRIRNNYKTHYGATTGLEYARVLFGRWALVTLGGDDDCHTAYEGTLIEANSVADSALSDDGIICAAFAAHSIYDDGTCP